jgi:TolA-binding protein
MARWMQWSILAMALPLPAEHAPAPVKSEARQQSSKPGSGRLTDAQAGELAKEALTAQSATSIRAALDRLKGHSFKTSKVPERELVLYAQGLLEARLGNMAAAAVALKKLERQWPKSPFMGEGHIILAEDAITHRRFKEAEDRLHQALAADIPSEQKRKPQELLIWTLVEQDRPREALPIIQSLLPLSGKEKPSERGLAGIAAAFCATGDRAQAQASMKDFQNLYPSSPLLPRLELSWGRLLGRSREAPEAAQILRKLIKEHPGSPEADDARLALANLLTDGSLPEGKDLPTAESLLAEVRRGGKNGPKGTAQLVELRLLVGKTLWEDALNLVDRIDPVLRETLPEVKKLWAQAWNAWVGQRLEKGFPGELLARLKPSAFAALEPSNRVGVVELFASSGLLDTLPRLLVEIPAKDRPALRKAALAKAQPEAQAQAVLRILPAKGESGEEALMKVRAEAALEHWPALRAALGRVKPGPERVKAVVRLLQRPVARPETPAQRLAEAEGWLARAPEKGETREPLAILVADLRMQHGDARGALALYPSKPAAADQRGWVALMRAQALVKLGQRDQARLLIKESREEQGFRGQRDALAKGLGAY